ncbi:MAG: glycosyltransferase [Flavobacteriales bacterium]|nr:glycosyltransferase [Flavobacteriales bacterium]
MESDTKPMIDRLRRVLWIAVLTAMPLWPDALPALVAALLLAMAPWEKPRGTWSWPSWRGALPWLAVYYLWHVAGMLWSEDHAHGLFDLEVKALMLLVPLIFAWGSGAWQRHTVFAGRVFVHTVAITFLALLLRSSWLFITELRLRDEGIYLEGLPYTNIFFTSYYSPWLHPSYLAMYGVFALALLTWTDREGTWPKPLRWLERYLWPAMLVLGVVLTASKTGWSALLLLLLHVLIARRKDHRLRRAALGIALGAAIVLGSLIASFSTVRGKITETWAALRQTDPDADDSSSARRLVWRAGASLVAEHPWCGTGTGDVKNELVRLYAERGYRHPLEKRLNAHSQFLQTAVALGLPAALWSLSLLLVPLYHARRDGRHIAVFLLLLAALNWSVESMLEVQAGVVFFTLFAALFASPSSQRSGPLRIILLTQYFPPETGAPQNRLLAMAKGLRDRGAEITVLTAMPNYPDMRVHQGYRGRFTLREHIDGLDVRRVWLFVSRGRGLFARLLNYFSFVGTSIVYGLLKLRRADILLVESPPLFLGIAAICLARVKGARLVFNVSDLWPESAVKLGLVKNRLAIAVSTWLEMRCYRAAALITGQTQGIVADIQRRCPGKDVLWIPNGVDLDQIEGVDPAGARERHGIASDAYVVAYTGIIGHAQGLEVVLRAAERLRDAPRVQFLLVGDGPERVSLSRLAGSMGLDNVRFIAPLPRTDALTLVAASDAAVIPLRKEKLFEGAIPSKIFEALALGKPILLGVEGEAKDLFIDQGHGGLAFVPEDDAALADAVRRLLEEPTLGARLGSQGASFVRERFDRSRITDILWERVRVMPR